MRYLYPFIRAMLPIRYFILPRFVRLVGVLLSLTPFAAVAQSPAPEFPRVTIAGRLHTQAYFFDNEAFRDDVGARSNFIIRRARIQAVALMSDRVSVTVMPSFENSRGRGDFRLRDAYLDLRLTDPAAATALTLRVGQEKRPFSRLELSSSNNLPGVERGAGPGLVPVQSIDLFGAAGFLAHDVGAAVLLSSGPFALRAGIYNGTGEANGDANDAKSFGARLTYAATRKLSVGGAVFSHDGIVGADSSFRNTAFEVDAQWGRPGDPGLYVLGELLEGEAFRAGDQRMRGLVGVLAYHVRRSAESPVYAIEPAVRLDIADGDLDLDDNGSTLISGALGLYFTPRTQLRIALERQSFQLEGLPAITGVRMAVFVNF